LNDNFFGIGFFQELPADRIQTGPAKRSRVQALHVSAIDMENAPNLRDFAHQLDRAGRSDDPNYPDRPIGRVIQFNEDLRVRPHIRASRTYLKREKGLSFPVRSPD
jgi:hypothetical protein